MEYLYTVLKFLIGGGIVIGVPYLAEHIDPRLGGLLTVAPIVTILAFIITRIETSHATTQSLVGASFYFAIPFVFFLIAMYFLMNRFSFAPSLAGASLVWITAVLLTSRLLHLL
jgi:uncharacterized membrane protein (GlpM family)